MRLHLLRHTWTAQQTMGTLYVDGLPYCYTVEDADRWLLSDKADTKVPGETCIPASHDYQVVVTYSPRFKRPMPLLMDVPYFTGVRVHWGTDHVDTEGCLLVGYQLRLPGAGTDRAGVYASRAAFQGLHVAISKAVKQEAVTLSIDRGKVPLFTMELLGAAWASPSA